MSPTVASVARTTKPKSPKPAPVKAPQDTNAMSVDWDIAIARIVVQHNDRTEFDKKAIETLAMSMRERGLDNAITVRKSGEGFELIAGERRLRAARSLGWTVIRARIIEADDKSADLLRLEENLLREDLNQIERAAGIKRYIEKHSESQSAVGKRFGMTQAQVSNLLRLLQLPEFWQDQIKSGKVPHTIARDVLCPWHHRPQLLEFVAQHSDIDDEQSFQRDVLISLIHQGIRSLTRSCRREAYFEFQTYHDHHCCFKLDDKNRHVLDVEDSPQGEPRAWNVKAWEELNAPALKTYKERQKKDKASHGLPVKSKGKAAKTAKVEQTCDERKLLVALNDQLCNKLASVINVKKHKASIMRVLACITMLDDLTDFLAGTDSFKRGQLGRVQILGSLPDNDFPAFICNVVANYLRSECVYLDCDVLVALASMLPIDLMHDWTPSAAVLEAYSESQLVAFAHDCEIDHTLSRLNLIIALTAENVWQPGHVPMEVTEILKGGGK